MKQPVLVSDHEEQLVMMAVQFVRFLVNTFSRQGARALAVLAALSLASFAYGASFGDDPFAQQEDEFLPPDEAFIPSASVAEDGAVRVNFSMPDGYYLYKHRFNFKSRGEGASLGAPEIPPGKKKVDDWEGEVEVYYHNADVRIPVTGQGTIDVSVGYQGCADAGLCYAPEQKWFTLDVGRAGGGVAGAGQVTPAIVSDPASSAGAGSAAAPVVPQTEEQALAATLAESSLLVSLAIMFALGIGLAFTPCVLPMVPILSSIIVGESENLSRSRAFTLSLAYVLGMALTYALLGTLVGLFGAELNLQAALQSPAVLITFSIVFVALSFSMFGFYELQLPQSWQNSLNNLGQKQGGGKHPSVFITGALSSLVVSPCVSAPLAGTLIYISTTNDAVLGGAALLALGLGMGFPLLLIGVGGGHLLPRAGAWMNAVKSVFGVLLLGVAIWLLERVVPESVTLMLWAALLIGSAVYMGALDFSPRQGWGQLWKATGAMSLVYGVLLIIGAASGANDPLRPLQPLTASAQPLLVSGGTQQAQAEVWRKADSLPAVLDIVATSGGKPVLVDFYADWCVSCKVMERSVFTDPQVAAQMNQFVLIKADVTDNNEAHKALLNEYRLPGPPSFIFFAADGREMSEVRILGEKNAESFAAHLSAVLGVAGGASSLKVGEIAGI